jgi:hypothetical protein
MSQTVCQPDFLVPMRWRLVGGDLSRPNRADKRADRPLILSTRPVEPHCTLPGSCIHRSRWPSASIAPASMAGAGINPHSAPPGRVPNSRDFVPWRF